MLAGLAVPLGQGYLFGRPGPSLVRDVPIAGLRPVTGDLGALLDGPVAPTLDAGLLAAGAEPPAGRAARSSSCSTAMPAPSACSCPRAAAGRIASGR